MSDDEKDVFEDAADSMTMDLEASMIDVAQSVNLFLNNKFEDSRALLERQANSSMYHALGLTVLDFIQALLAFDQTFIKRASQSLDKLLHLTEETRYKSRMKMVKTPNYKTYTPIQVHAELCNSEALLLKTMLSLIEDESAMTFVKAVVKIRACYNTYKECKNIQEVYTWESDLVEKNFLSGVKMGLGMFNLMMSLLPRRIIKLLEFIGFTADREEGFRDLEDAGQLEGTIRYAVCNMSLLCFHLFITPSVTHKLGDNVICSKVLDVMLKKHPDGILFLLFKGRLEYMKGNFDDAGKWYRQAWKSQELWRQFHHICFWEMAWISLINQDYADCLIWCNYLVDESRWSRTIYNYLKALILLKLNRPREEVNEVMMVLPTYKKTMAGKSVPTEKFVIKRSKRYFNQNHKLYFALYEMVYVYNLFKVLEQNPNVMSNTLKMIEKELEEVPMVGEYSTDNRCLGVFLKGCCLARMKCSLQAEVCFEEVINNEKNLKEDAWLVPFSYFEVSIIKQRERPRQEAKHYLEGVKKKFSSKKFALDGKWNYRLQSLLNDVYDNK